MNYLDQKMVGVQAVMSDMTAGNVTGAELLSHVRAILFESFKNGQKFCPKCNPKPKTDRRQ